MVGLEHGRGISRPQSPDRRLIVSSCHRSGSIMLAAAKGTTMAFRFAHRLTLTWIFSVTTVAIVSLVVAAQNAGRGAIQTPGGGRGPGAAPDASDPANASADLSPKPPVLPVAPDEQVKRFWLPPGYRLTPVLSEPVVED